ncbi:MAG: hypothetical protein Q9180_001361 [Flavoplaca navasiana]
MAKVKPPRQWSKKQFREVIGLSESEVEQMRQTVEVWLSSDPIPGGLRFASNKAIAKEYATTQLAQTYSGFFQRSPNPHYASKAPYGFVAWALEAHNAKVKKEPGARTGSMEPSNSQALSHVSSSETTGQISPLPHNPKPREQIGSSSQEFDWLRILAFTSEGQPGSRARVSLDEILVDPPSGIILPARLAVRFVSYQSLMSCVKYRSLLLAPHLVLIAREDPSFADTGRRQLIDSDSILREAIRYMLGIRGRSLDFWVADAAREVVVEDLLTRPIPIPVTNAPPAFTALLSSTAPPILTSASVPGKRSTDEAISKVPPKPSLLLKLKVSKDAFARLEHREEEHTAAGQDEDEPPFKRIRQSIGLTRPPTPPRIPSPTGDLEPSDYEPSDYEPSESEGFEPAASDVNASEDLGDNSDIAMLDDPVYNPMFDPDAASMGDLTGEGNRELAEEDDDDVLYHLVDKLTSHSMLSKCEVLDYWPDAAAAIKADSKQLSSDPCVRVPELAFKLYQYQWLGVYVMFIMCLSDRNGVILADEMGMGKTLQTIALLVLIRHFIVNCREVDEEWDNPPEEAESRKHCHRDGSGHCSVNQDSWFTCVCIQGTPHYGLRPTDGHFQIIAPPGMLGTWIREWAKFYKPADPAQKMELVVGHSSLGKGTATFGDRVTLADGSVYALRELLTGPTPSLPAAPQGDEHCEYREANGEWVLRSGPTGRYRKSSPRLDASRLVVVSSHQSWTKHVKDAAPEHVRWYTNTEKGYKLSPQRFQTIVPGMVIVDEAHTCTSSAAGHYKVMKDIDSMTLHTVKKVLLSGTPIRKGPGDLIAMIEAMESKDWKQPGHFLNGLTAAKLKTLNDKFSDVRTIHDAGLQAIIDAIAKLMPLVAIRRTNESRWFHLSLRPPVESIRQDREVEFPPQYLPVLNKLRDHVAAHIDETKTSDGGVSKTQMTSMTRLYRMTSNTPFLASFWSMHGTAEYKFLATDMQKWLFEDGTLSPDCPLVKHAAEIRANSPKLDFIGKVLDTMTNPGTGKLIIVTDFLWCAWSVFDYVNHHPSKQSALLYHAGLKRKTREAMCEGFQQLKRLDDVTQTKLAHPEWDKRVWIGTIKTMGLGLTLTAADKVIVLEPNTMPTDEAQAIARAIRIGQLRKVYVNRLICPAVGVEKVILNTSELRDFLVTRAFVA